MAFDNDYNQDGAILAIDHELSASCEGNPSQDSWANLDYIGNECGGLLEDRGTILDYTRAFWDADQGQGLTTTQIFALWDAADPHSWDGDGGGSNGNDPQERLEGAAATLGVLNQWNNVDNANGIR